MTPIRFIFASIVASFGTSACALFSSAQPSAGPPNTDIYIADLSTIGERLWIGELHPVATTARYENQPFFTNDGQSLIYTAAGTSGKTDLWQRTLTSGETRQLTRSPNMSEYSPRISSDGATLTFIQEDETGEITELYSQATSGGSGTPVLALKPLGYYAFFVNDPRVITFLRADTPSLVLTDPDTGETQTIASNIGRALYAADDGNSAYFTTATTDENFEVQQYNVQTGETRAVFPLPVGVQDYAAFVIPGTTLTAFFAASGTNLQFRLDHPESTEWITIADLSGPEFTDITRIAVNKTATRIALVTETKADSEG